MIFMIFMIRNSAAHHIRIPSSAVRCVAIFARVPWPCGITVSTYSNHFKSDTEFMRPKHQISRADVISIPGSFAGTNWRWNDVERLPAEILQLRRCALQTSEDQHPSKDERKTNVAKPQQLTGSNFMSYHVLSRWPS